MPTRSVTIAAEADSAFPQTPNASVAGAPAGAETDTVFDLAPPPAASLAVVPAVETDAATFVPPPTGVLDAQLATRGAVSGIGLGTGPFGQAPFGGDKSELAIALRPTGDTPAAPVGEFDLGFPLEPPPTDADYEEAITAADRVPELLLRADWNQTGTFDHPLSDMTGVLSTITVTRELAGSLPAEVAIVEGHSAATMSFTVEGEWGESAVDPVSAFAPYRTDAAFYQTPVIEVPVELWTGFNTRTGPQLTKRFTGSLSRINPSSAARDVKIDALDGANRLRAAIYQPAIGMDTLLLAKYGPVQYFSRINSQWLIDRILRANEVCASPPALGKPQVSVTMHGSAVPEIGLGGMPTEVSTGSPQTTEAWTNAGHPFGMLYSNPDAPEMSGTWTCFDAFTAGINDSIEINALVRLPNTAIDSPSTRYMIRVSLGTNGAVFLGIWNGRLAFGYTDQAGNLYAYYVSGTPLPATPTWVSFAGRARFTSNTTMDLTWDLGGSTYTVTGVTVPARSGAWDRLGIVYYRTPVPYTNVTIHQNDAFLGAGAGLSWVPQATIDPGLNEWYGFDAIQGEDSWSLLTEVVAAEFGGCGFDEDGHFWFRSRGSSHDRGTPEVITADRTLADMVTVTDEAAVRNYITGITQAYMVGDWEDVIVSKDRNDFTIAPGETTFDIDVDPSIALLPSYPVPVIAYTTNDDWNTHSDDVTVRSKVRWLATMDGGDNLVPLGNIGIQLMVVQSGLIRIVFTNTSGKTILFSTISDTQTDTGTGEVTITPGQPSLKIPGRKLAAQGEVTTTVFDQGSINVYGPRSYDLGGKSRFRQHPNSVAALAGSVLGSIGQPVPVLDAVEVPHDPRRQLYDRVIVEDDQGLGSVHGTITGIVTKFDKTAAATDELTVRPSGPPGLGLLDDPQLGEVGVSLIFGP